ncbi:MAG: hypothetical protein P4L73_14745 [Caulobacteraceae bacterium]|nr:hypothetical protein [Caulobacteraceae bacterium]
MTSTVTNASAVPDPTYGSSPPATPAATPADAPQQGEPSAPNPADLRLVIEEDLKAGCFVYKTVDWRTGKVVQQLPRAQLVKMREAENYAVGAVVDTSA